MKNGSVQSLIGACAFTGIQQRDVSETLCFHLSTGVQQNGVFKNFLFRERFLKDTFPMTVFNEYVWTEGQTGEKKLAILVDCQYRFYTRRLYRLWQKKIISEGK